LSTSIFCFIHLRPRVSRLSFRFSAGLRFSAIYLPLGPGWCGCKAEEEAREKDRKRHERRAQDVKIPWTRPRDNSFGIHRRLTYDNASPAACCRLPCPPVQAVRALASFALARGPGLQLTRDFSSIFVTTNRTRSTSFPFLTIPLFFSLLFFAGAG
jgi:hypothetical protein